MRMGAKLDTMGLDDAFARAKCHRPTDGKVWHMLRHTFASHAMMSGASLYGVQRLLGHATPKMTQRYAHLSPDHLASEVARLSFTRGSATVTRLGTVSRA
jgi:site-specific recombinase XerD